LFIEQQAVDVKIRALYFIKAEWTVIYLDFYSGTALATSHNAKKNSRIPTFELLISLSISKILKNFIQQIKNTT
jgi:hypothetical protein